MSYVLQLSFVRNIGEGGRLLMAADLSQVPLSLTLFPSSLLLLSSSSLLHSSLLLTPPGCSRLLLLITPHDSS